MPDFLQGCMEDLKTDDEKSFGETFCIRCKNPECDRAGWSRDRFGNRVVTQAERLLHPKHQVTQAAGSRFEHLKDFVDLTKQALRLEVADRRGDWAVPGEVAPRAFVELSPQPKVIVPEPVKHEPEPVVDTAGPEGPTPPTPNTPKPPPEGIMVGGGPTVASPQAPKVASADDWDVKPTVTKVAPGARIQLGKKL